MIKVWYVANVKTGEIVAAYFDERRTIDHMNRLNKEEYERYNADVQRSKGELYPHIQQQKEYHYGGLEVTE